MKPGFKQSTRLLAKRLGCSSEQMLEGFAPAQAADLDQVIPWRAENQPEELPAGDRDYLRWRYNFGDNTLPGNRKSFLWLLKIKGEILCMMGAQHHTLHTGGQNLDIAYPLDLLVRKDLNGSGLGAWINLAIQDKYPILLVIGGGTRDSARLIRRLFRAMPDRKTWKLPVSTEGTLRRLLPIAILARPISTVADGLLSLKRGFHRGTWRASGIHLEPIERFPGDIARLTRNWPTEDIYLERSADFLNWRFIDNPGIDYQALLIYRKQQLLGYVVYHLYHSLENKQMQASIDDLIWERGGGISAQQQRLQCILAASIDHLIARKARLISLASYGDQADRTLQQLGFLRRKDEQTFSIFSRMADDDYLFQPERWYLSNAEAHGMNF